jgi:hypothetical protein
MTGVPSGSRFVSQMMFGFCSRMQPWLTFVPTSYPPLAARGLSACPERPPLSSSAALCNDRHALAPRKVPSQRAVGRRAKAVDGAI